MLWYAASFVDLLLLWFSDGGDGSSDGDKRYLDNKNTMNDDFDVLIQ